MKHIILIILINLVFTQEDELKQDKFHYNNRWEGVLHKNVSGSFRMLSFTSEKPTAYTDKDTLQIHFFMEDTTKTLIKSSKIFQDKVNYQMQVENQKWSKGWNTFTPWPTKDVLIKQNISAKNLAVLIKGRNNIYIPARVTKSSQKSIKTINKYAVHFFTPANIVELNYTVTSNVSQKVICDGLLEDLDAKDPFRINLEMFNAKAGKYALMLNVKWNSGSSSVKKYHFYHSEKN